jgi:soluble lytic murein transglycosylase
MADAQLQLDSMKPGPLHAIARAEIYTAKNSPKVESRRSWLARRGARSAAGRAARPDGQGARRARHCPCPPRRPAARLVRRRAGPPARPLDQERHRRDFEIALEIQPFVKADDGVQAEAVVDKFAPTSRPRR